MISITELARSLHPCSSRRYFLIFSFHCDISFDGNPQGNVKGNPHEPRTYVFAGFFAADSTWKNVADAWDVINLDYKVTCFHAAHLNGKTHEYSGWDDTKKIEYSKKLLDVIHGQGNRMYAVACGIFADEHRRIIGEDGRRKMGSPYLVCFNSCITRVARMMDEPGSGNIQPEDKFSVLIDTDDGYLDAIRNFVEIKENKRFPHSSRLATCAPLGMEECVAMQPADLIAYEVFKRLNTAIDIKGEFDPRHVLKSMMKENVVNECYFGSETLLKNKDRIESTPSDDGKLVIVPEN